MSILDWEPRPKVSAHKRKNRGFASMPAEQRRELASLGGKSLRPEQRSFSVNRALAAEAGSKGGSVSRKPK
jgi:general stress protein YciG